MPQSTKDTKIRVRPRDWYPIRDEDVTPGPHDPLSVGTLVESRLFPVFNHVFVGYNKRRNTLLRLRTSVGDLSRVTLTPRQRESSLGEYFCG